MPEPFETSITAWTIRIALVCMATTFAIRIGRLGKPATKNDEGQTPHFTMEIAKSVWLIGSLFSLLHAIASMGFYHQFSHSLAMEDTARQTESLLGVRVGIGLWFNYVFVATWLLDAFWWIGTPIRYERRPGWITKLVYGFLAFIAINGAIVFESGTVRWISLAIAALLAGFYWFAKRRTDTTRGAN